MSLKVAKRHVAHELPDARALTEHGVDTTVEEAQLALALVSRMLVHGNANHRVDVGRAAKMIALAMSLPLEDEDGVVLAGVLPKPQDGFIPKGTTAEKRLAEKILGFTPSAMNRAMETGSTLHVTSCLPAEVVFEYLPGRAVKYMAAFIACGPYEAADRISAAASERGQTMTAKALDAQLTPTATFMRLIGDLRADYGRANDRRKKTGRPPIAVPASLAQWTFVPDKLSMKQIKAKAVGGRRLETSAVPPELVEQRLFELARAAQWGRWKPEEWPFNRNWKALKDFVLLSLLAALAPRVEHLANLDVRDVVLDCTFRDGTHGPALLFRGGDLGMKLRDETYEFAVRLPDPLRDILVAWLHCNGNEPTAHAKSGQAPRQYEDVRPLIPAYRKRAPEDLQKCHTALGDRVRGREATATGHAVRPLVPEKPGSLVGFQAHRFRSTFTQEVERLAKKWREESPGAALSGYHERVFAELPVDHTEKDYGYRDLRTTDGYPTARSEQIVALAVQLRWDDLWGDGPYLRRGLDADAIRDAHEHVELLEAEIHMHSRQISELHQQVAQHLDSALKRTELADRLEGSLHAHALRNEIDIRVERREHLRAARDEARLVRQEAVVREVMLPEDIDPDEHARAVAEALALIEGSEVVELETPALPLAAELTVADIAELFGVTTQHVGRWRNGESSPPVDPANWIEHNKKDFRYPASALDGEVLRRIPADDPRQRVNAVLARRAQLGYPRRPAHLAA